MIRVGLGFDVHPFGGDGPLVLGGVEIDGRGLAGHSDADVVAHAVADSLLGPVGLPDLGSMFPAAEREVGLLRLSEALRGVVAQRLLPKKDDDGRISVVEVLVCTPAARACLRDADKLEDLEEEHRDVGVGLVDLVEEDDGGRTPPDGVRELPALAVADVARRGADEARDAGRLAALAHVDPDERVAAPEEGVGERAGELRLPDTGRAEEDEGADRPGRGPRA